MNVAILFASFGPYHKARMEALSSRLQDVGSKLYCLRFTEGSDQYAWDPCSPSNAEFATIGGSSGNSRVGALSTAYNYFRYIRNTEIDVALLPSYSPLPNLLCIFAAKLAGAKIVLMCDSWAATEGAGAVGRAVKRTIFRLFDAALVAGQRHIDYVVDYGVPRDNVFPAYDVIDVDYFERLSESWKGTRLENQAMRGLPGRYFLNVGRFVEKKNLEVLIDAYAILIAAKAVSDIALVLVGDGPLLDNLKERANYNNLRWIDGMSLDAPPVGPCVVHFPFQQVHTTPLFFGRCEAFVLPSLLEEWGLVVNEAMACSAPVIVSDRAGCAPDLVFDGHNGFTFDPSNPGQLADLMMCFVSDAYLSSKMGGRGRKIIEGWRPETFANNAILASTAAVGLGSSAVRHKVSFLVESLDVSSGGTALEVATLAKELAKNPSIAVTIITFDGTPPFYSGGDRVHTISHSRPGSPLGWPLTWKKISSTLHEQDVVFVTGVWGPFDGLGLRLKWPRRARVFIRVCGMLEPYILRRNRWKKNLGKFFYVKRNLRSAAGIITNSTPETMRLKNMGLSAPLLCIPNGVSTPPHVSRNVSEIRLKLGIPEDKIVFLYLGRIHPKKGMHVMLDSLGSIPNVAAGDSNVHILVCGGYVDGVYEKTVREKISSYGLGKIVQFCGEVSGEAKEEMFSCADVFILPSESEGLPNAVLEAMARGLPVILTEGCNIPEIQEFDAGKVTQFDAESIAGGIRWAMQGSQVLHPAGENAKRLISERFNLVTAVERYTAIITGSDHPV